LADDNNNGNSSDQEGINLPDGSREPLSPQEMDNTDYGLLQGERIQPIDLQQEMRESYLSYALSVIVERALPDVRDGMSLGLGLTYAVHKLATYQLDGSYRLGLLVVDPSHLSGMVTILDVLLLVLFELLIPLLRRGKTLGATFTHMTVETKVRRGWSRVVFYAFRTAVILAIFGPWTGTMRQWTLLLAVVLFIFYLFKRQMPYDLLPGQDWSHQPSPAVR